jgi:hypothetical protein
MTPRSQLIFDKSDSVCSRYEECENHSHVKTEKFRSDNHHRLPKFRLDVFKEFLKVTLMDLPF